MLCNDLLPPNFCFDNGQPLSAESTPKETQPCSINTPVYNKAQVKNAKQRKATEQQSVCTLDARSEYLDAYYGFEHNRQGNKHQKNASKQWGTRAGREPTNSIPAKSTSPLLQDRNKAFF